MTTDLTDHDSRIPVGLKQPQEQDCPGDIGGFVPSGSRMRPVPRTDTTGADCSGVPA